MRASLPKAWQRRGWLSALLWPAAGVFGAAAAVRRAAYRKGWARPVRAGVPVVVIGNITVGGTGKTPIAGWLAERLKSVGRRPAIVSRGYGGQRQKAPARVTGRSDPAVVGDEPVMLARQAGCPVWVCIDRARAVRRAVLEGADIVLSDDGLQHYRMARDVEICVVDGVRGLGNGRLLPAGPLREPPSRLDTVDCILVQGGSGALPGAGREQGRAAPLAALVAFRGARFELRLDHASRLDGGGQRPLGAFAGRRVLALAGVGAPERFHAALEKAGLDIEPVAAPDHGRVPMKKLLERRMPVIMTAKDAVKYPPARGRDLWCAPARVVMPEDCAARIVSRLLAIPGNTL